MAENIENKALLQEFLAGLIAKNIDPTKQDDLNSYSLQFAAQHNLDFNTVRGFVDSHRAQIAEHKQLTEKRTTDYRGMGWMGFIGVLLLTSPVLGAALWGMRWGWSCISAGRLVSPFTFTKKDETAQQQADQIAAKLSTELAKQPRLIQSDNKFNKFLEGITSKMLENQQELNTYIQGFAASNSLNATQLEKYVNNNKDDIIKYKQESEKKRINATNLILAPVIMTANVISLSLTAAVAIVTLGTVGPAGRSSVTTPIPPIREQSQEAAQKAAQHKFALLEAAKHENILDIFTSPAQGNKEAKQNVNGQLNLSQEDDRRVKQLGGELSAAITGAAITGTQTSTQKPQAGQQPAAAPTTRRG